MIDNNLANKMKLQGQEEKLTLQWIGNKSTTQATSKVDLKISGVKNNDKQYQLKNVRTVDNLQLPVQTLRLADLNLKDRRKNLPIQEYSQVRPKILIGLDNAYLGIAKKTLVIGHNEPNVVLTKLGWVVYGTTDDNLKHAFSCYVNTLDEEESLEKLVKDFIIHENLYENNTAKNVEPVDIIRAKNILEHTTKRKGFRFETGLLWKSDDLVLPDNRAMAEKRLFNLEKKLKKDNNLRVNYNKAMSDYVAKGSALLSGPDLCVSLLTVLMKFRQKPIAVTADIAEMFSQVRIRDEDQYAQRYLWRSSPENKIDEYALMVMTFGATCSPCSAQYVKNKNAEEFRHMYEDAVDAITHNHYVDDYVHCFADEEEAVRITKQVICIHKQGGFNLTKFNSNSEIVLKELGAEQNNNVLSLNKDTTQKVLGMCWDVNNDVLKFALSFGKVAPDLLNMKRIPTKREVLGIAMSVFDPFGVAAEYTLGAKLLLQSIWKLKISWDDAISVEAFETWKRWLLASEDIKSVSIPRCYNLKFFYSDIELHIFADASEVAYAAVAYWKILSSTDEAKIVFCMGKSKCAPLKVTTIPRLELQGAVLATRLRKLILSNHNIKPNKVVMWSDSKTVVAWIKSDQRRYKSFVAHRVNEILESTNLAEWRWLPGVLNPADFGTRERQKEKESRWIKGPDFMKADTIWPDGDICGDTKEELRTTEIVMVINVELKIFTNFSTYLKLQRVIATVLRFYHNLSATKTKTLGPILVSELRQAEIAILRCVQISTYNDDYNSVKSNNEVKKSSTLYKLTPILDNEGLIRINGRLNNAVYVQACTRNPVILPQKHHVATLIIDFYHKIWGHQNENTIVAEIRRKYWVPHLREEVKRAEKRCNVCKIRRAKPQNPQMGQLPNDRLEPYVRPFSYVGLDYMGLFTIKIGRRNEKRWIALFTCLTIRAIHLEIAYDLSTETCLMCIQNFINRRGKPVRIRSDNGTNFLGAQKMLQEYTTKINNV